MAGKVIHSGEYRTSADNRQWRIIEKMNRVGVEEEERKDAMDKPVFGPVKLFEINGAPWVIFSRLLAMVKAGHKLAMPSTLPGVILEGEIPAAGEKNKLSWRMVATAQNRGIVCEEEVRRDGLGEIVYKDVEAFGVQCSVEKAIFQYLLEKLK